MVTLAAAGPAANLGTAAALTVAANATDPLTARLALYGAALTATLLGVVNLIPASSPRSDGAQLFHWLLRPALMRAALAAAHFQDEVGRMLRTIVTPEGDDEARRALADFTRRCGAGAPCGDPDHVPAAERLVALADGADREVAAAIRQAITLQFGMWYLRSAVMSGEPVARTETAEIAGLAQAAFDADPTARVPLALAHLLNHRPDDARSLLLDVRPDAELFPVAVLLRAVAERGPGDPADLALPADRYPYLAEVVATARAADPMPPLFAPA
jgi:hypothetical protein